MPTGFDAEGDAAEFTGTKWFGELSLYADGTLHQPEPYANPVLLCLVCSACWEPRSTLSAQTFCETFSLRGPDLARCVSQSRGCASARRRVCLKFLHETPRRPAEAPPCSAIMPRTQLEGFGL